MCHVTRMACGWNTFPGGLWICVSSVYVGVCRVRCVCCGLLVCVCVSGASCVLCEPCVSCASCVCGGFYCGHVLIMVCRVCAQCSLHVGPVDLSDSDWTACFLGLFHAVGHPACLGLLPLWAS